MKAALNHLSRTYCVFSSDIQQVIPLKYRPKGQWYGKVTLSAIKHCRDKAAIQSHYTRQCSEKANWVVRDPTHLRHSVLPAVSEGRNPRLTDSFITQAIRLLNSWALKLITMSVYSHCTGALTSCKYIRTVYTYILLQDLPLTVSILYNTQWGGWSSVGRAGRLVIGRSLILIPAELSCMSKCPWAKYWPPNCSWCADGTLHGGLCHQWGPCVELATCPGCILPSPRDSWDWLQQKTPRPHKRDKAVTDNGRMRLPYTEMQRALYCIEITDSWILILIKSNCDD